MATLLARPCDPRGLEDLAVAAGASGRTLSRLFLAETGLSFGQWRQQARLTETMAALTTGGRPIRATALAGYAR